MLFICFPYSDVHYLDPHCIRQINVLMHTIDYIGKIHVAVNTSSVHVQQPIFMATTNNQYQKTNYIDNKILSDILKVVH